MVGINADAIGLDIGNVVGTGAGITTSAGDVGAIFGGGSAIPVHDVLKAEDLAIFIAANFDVGDQALAYKVGKEFFFTGED